MDDITAKVIELVRDELSLSTPAARMPAEITADHVATRDLGVDSLDHVTIIMRLEQEFNVEILDADSEFSEEFKMSDYVAIVNKSSKVKVS